MGRAIRELTDQGVSDADSGYRLWMVAVPGPSDPFFQDVVSTPRGELKVSRDAWGWYVCNGERDARSRYLDEAFEGALGRPLDHTTLRALVEMLDRELTAERHRHNLSAP